MTIWSPHAPEMIDLADLPCLRAFTRGLDQDRNAVDAGLTLPCHNGGTEGVNTKTNRIMLGTRQLMVAAAQLGQSARL